MPELPGLDDHLLSSSPDENDDPDFDEEDEPDYEAIAEARAESRRE